MTSNTTHLNRTHTLIHRMVQHRASGCRQPTATRLLNKILRVALLPTYRPAFGNLENACGSCSRFFPRVLSPTGSTTSPRRVSPETLKKTISVK